MQASWHFVDPELLRLWTLENFGANTKGSKFDEHKGLQIIYGQLLNIFLRTAMFNIFLYKIYFALGEF